MHQAFRTHACVLLADHRLRNKRSRWNTAVAIARPPIPSASAMASNVKIFGQSNARPSLLQITPARKTGMTNISETICWTERATGILIESAIATVVLTQLHASVPRTAPAHSSGDGMNSAGGCAEALTVIVAAINATTATQR